MKYPTLSALDGHDYSLADAYLRRDLPVNMFMFSWLENYGILTPGRRLFYWHGVFKERLNALSLIINDSFLVLSSESSESAELLAHHYLNYPDRVEHIVGSEEVVLEFWKAYKTRYPSPRLIRPQEFLSLSASQFRDVQRDKGKLRLAERHDLDAVYFASAAMHLEETFKDPLEDDPLLFRRHIEHRILTEQCYVWFEKDRLVFKADISANASLGAQISGVYVPPMMRDQGYGTRGMAALCSQLFDRGFPTVALYVNSDNGSARHMYAKLGFQKEVNYYTIFLV